MIHFGRYDLTFCRKFLLVLLACCLACNPVFTPEPAVKARTLVVSENAPSDSVITAIMAPYKSRLDQEMKTIIGRAGHHLDNHPGWGESGLGNFVADLLLVESQKRYDQKIDMAIINAHGGLRTTIGEGPVTRENIFELMPFENYMLVVELSGELTKRFFDHCAKTRRNILAGARFAIKGEKAINININGRNPHPDSTYILAVSDYLANGGGGFGFLGETDRVTNLNYKIRDMIIDHIKNLTAQNKVIEGRLDGRIKIMN